MFKKKKELTFEDVKVLQIKDGDTVFLTTKGQITEEQYRGIKKIFVDMLSNRGVKDVKCVILEHGMRVKK